MQEDYNNNLIDTKVSVEQLLDLIEQSKNANLLKISELKEELVNQDKNYNQLAQDKLAEVDKVLSSLESEIEKYQSIHTKEAEEKKINNNRNLVLRLKKGQIDKVVKEAKESINSLEKEYNEKMNSLKAEITRLKKEYTSTVGEAEKKAKVEVKKITDAILAPTIKDEEEVDLISASEEELFNRFLKSEEKIYDLRMEGIINIASLKKEYYEVKHENDKNYYLRKIELEKEILEIKNKEDEEVANFKHIIKEETNRLRDEEYFTNYNAKINLEAVDYKNKLYQEKLKQKAYDQIKEMYANIDAVNDNIYNHLKELLSLIKTCELELIDNLYKLINALKDEEIDDLNKFVGEVKQYILKACNCLVTNEFNEEYLGDYNYNNHMNEVNGLISKLFECLDIKKDEASVSSLLNKFKENISNSIEKAYCNGINYANSLLENEKLRVEEDRLLHKEWHLTKSLEVKANKYQAKKEYLQAIELLIKDKQEYTDKYTKEYLTEIDEFKKSMAIIKKQPKIIKDKYEKDLKDETLRIEKEYFENIKNVNLEEQTRKLMCKKN